MAAQGTRGPVGRGCGRMCGGGGGACGQRGRGAASPGSPSRGAPSRSRRRGRLREGEGGGRRRRLRSRRAVREEGRMEVRRGGGTLVWGWRGASGEQRAVVNEDPVGVLAEDRVYSLLVVVRRAALDACVGHREPWIQVGARLQRRRERARAAAEIQEGTMHRARAVDDVVLGQEELCRGRSGTKLSRLSLVAIERRSTPSQCGTEGRGRGASAGSMGSPSRRRGGRRLCTRAEAQRGLSYALWQKKARSCGGIRRVTAPVR